jgi:hypothetical protein
MPWCPLFTSGVALRIKTLPYSRTADSAAKSWHRVSLYGQIRWTCQRSVEVLPRFCCINRSMVTMQTYIIGWKSGQSTSNGIQAWRIILFPPIYPMRRPHCVDSDVFPSIFSCWCVNSERCWHTAEAYVCLPITGNAKRRRPKVNSVKEQSLWISQKEAILPVNVWKLSKWYISCRIRGCRYVIHPSTTCQSAIRMGSCRLPLRTKCSNIYDADVVSACSSIHMWIQRINGIVISSQRCKAASLKSVISRCFLSEVHQLSKYLTCALVRHPDKKRYCEHVRVIENIWANKTSCR